MSISDSAATPVVTANAASVTTASFTPTAGTLLVALCASGNGTGASSSLGTVTDSVSSTWTRLAGEASTSGGDAEVWVCDAGASPSARTVTWHPGGTIASGLLLSVRQVSGAKAAASQTGAHAVNGGTSTPTVAITTTTTGSLVMGAFATASNSYTLTANGATTGISQFNGSGGDTAAAYEAAALTGTPGSTTIGYSTATTSATDRMALAEILPSAGVSLSRSASDNAAGTDSNTRTLALPRTVSDASAGTDTASRAALTRSRTVTDTAHATDTAAGSYGRAVADTAPATDTAGRAAQTFARAAADTAAGADAASRTVAVGRAAADTAPATDTVTRTRSLPKAATDTAAATDAASRAVQTFTRSTTDASAGSADSLSFFAVGTGAAQILANPNWPLVGVDVDFATSAGPPDTPGTRYSLNAAALRRLITRKINIKRGRQYELDQVQTGECDLEIPDPLEVLNPDNTGSFFNDGTNNTLAPYRPMQVWAMWPNQPGSGNIWSIPSGADPSFATANGVFDGTVDGVSTIVNSTAQAFVGTHSVLVTQVGSGSGYGAYANSFVLTAPGVTYTASAYVYATGGATINIAVIDAAGTTHLGNTSTVQNGWARIFVPWTALDSQETVVIYGSGVATPTFYVDCVQLEFGNTANTWTGYGPTLYPLFTGFVERYPTTYDMNGQRAQRPLKGIDALGLLALTTIRQSYQRTIQADTPQIVMALDDASGPAQVTGNPTTSALASVSASGAVNFAGDTQLDGTPAVSLTQASSAGASTSSTTLSTGSIIGTLTLSVVASISAGSLIVVEQGTTNEEWAYVTGVSGAGPYIISVTRNPIGLVGLRKAHATGAAVASQNSRTSILTTPSSAAFTANFKGFTLEFWAKPTQGNVNVIAGENVTNSPDIIPFQQAGSSKVDSFVGMQSDGNALHLGLNDIGNPSYGSSLNAYADPAQSAYSPFPDGQWHYYAINVFQDPSNSARYKWKINIDGNASQTASSVGTPAIRVCRFNELMSAVTVETGHGSALSVARVAFYNYSLSDAQMVAHAARGMGNKGELSGTRAARLLNAYWGGAINVSGGFLELADDFSYDPTITTNSTTSSAGQARAVLDALQEIQESERGLVYASKAGTVVVEDRESRYQSQVSIATLGEDPTNAGAEYPYTDYAADFDPTYTFSQANLTSPYNQNWLPLQNATALAQYGQRVVSQQLQAVRDFDIEQAGVYYLTRYASPKTRISKLLLRPSANPALWPIILNLEISQRFTVKRRTPTGLTVTADHYVESIQHSIEPETGAWEVTVQMSPVFVPSAWLLGDATYGVLGTSTFPIY